MRRTLLIISLGIMAASLAGCDALQANIDAARKREQAAAKNAAATGADLEIVVPVEAQKPVRDDISDYFATTARVEAERRVDVLSEAVGRCTAVLVEEGDSVQRGDVLAELDKEEALASLAQTEVQVRQNKTTYDRIQRGYEEGLFSKEQLDNARFAYEQSSASLDTQKVQFDNLTIRAPISGVVTQRNVQLGTLVSSGAPAFTIIDPASFVLTIDVPDKELSRVREGQRGEVVIDALPGQTLTTKVRRVNPAVDPMSGMVKVLLDFQEDVKPRLREGSFARVRLITETRTGVLLVSKDAVIEENARRYLYVVAEENTPSSNTELDPGKTDAPTLTAQRVEVQTGLEDSADIEIVSGIDEDDQIVTMGQHALKPGSRVKITNAQEELAAKAQLTSEEALESARLKREAAEKAAKRRTAPDI